MACYEVGVLFGTLVAETILASVHVRAHQQAGHMDASDLIKDLQTLEEGPSTYGKSSTPCMKIAASNEKGVWGGCQGIDYGHFPERFSNP